MEILNQRLPKDLVNRIEEYAKDRTKYDKVMRELKRKKGKNASFKDWMSNLRDWINLPETLEKFRGVEDFHQQISRRRHFRSYCHVLVSLSYQPINEPNPKYFNTCNIM